MIKYKLPEFITGKNFNDETLGLIALERNLVKKLSMQYVYQDMIDLFKTNESLEEIYLDILDKYDTRGNCYLSLSSDVLLSFNNERLRGQLFQDVFLCMVRYSDNDLLVRMKKNGRITLKRDDCYSYKLFAEILFNDEKHVEEYFDVLSRDNGDISFNKYITAKNINSSIGAFIQKELRRCQDFDNQIIILLIKKLFDNSNINFLKVRAGKDVDGYLYFTVAINLHNNELVFCNEGKEINSVIKKIINRRMRQDSLDANDIKIERNDVLGIKNLVDVLFNNSVEGNNFIIALLRDELDMNIKNKEDKFPTKKCKI